MASVAQPMSWSNRSRAAHYLKLVLGGLATAAIGGFFAALFTYYATIRVNTANALQQQYLAAVQEFISTGSKLDASITDVADVVLDKDGPAKLDDARKSARQAIAAHTAAAQSLEPVIGTGNVKAYLEGVGALRLLLDDTRTAHQLLRTSQARFDVMHNRTLIVAEARKRIYG